MDLDLTHASCGMYTRVHCFHTHTGAGWTLLFMMNRSKLVRSAYRMHSVCPVEMRTAWIVPVNIWTPAESNACCYNMPLLPWLSDAGRCQKIPDCPVSVAADVQLRHGVHYVVTLTTDKEATLCHPRLRSQHRTHTLHMRRHHRVERLALGGNLPRLVWISIAHTDCPGCELKNPSLTLAMFVIAVKSVLLSPLRAICNNDQQCKIEEATPGERMVRTMPYQKGFTART